jgi:ATP-binding cassette subfamily B protein
MRATKALRESFAHTPRTLALVWKSSPRGTAGLAALTLAVAGLPVAMVWVGKQIVDAVVARSHDDSLRWVLIELGVVAALALATRLLGLVRGLLGARLSLDINAAILAKALRLELTHFEDPEFYDQLSRARREASSRPISVISQTFVIVQTVVGLLGFAALLLGFSPLAVLGLLIAAIPATVAEMRFSNVAFRLRNWRAPEARKLLYLEYVLANDDHAKEIKLFGLGPTLLARYQALGERFYGEDKILAIRRAGWGFALSLVGTAAFYGSYALMALAAAAGRITLGEMTLYLAAFRQGQQAFQSTLGAIGGMYEDSLYMSNLFAYLDIPVGGAAALAAPAGAPAPALAAADPHAPAPAPALIPAPAAFRGIRFENVGFRYPSSGKGGEEKWALRGIDVEIPAGQSLALVGENGAGKTTFIKLLTRLYRPTEGRIVLDGRDLANWDETELRARIGVIFQDFNQYQLAVRENVGFGSVEHLSDDARVGSAVDKGGATELIAGLGDGVNTQLGRWFKDGVELSGGQWQKLAIARAFMRDEADILVLDEPTAALDAEAERAVFERFRELTRGRTTILISHRFPTVRMADRIVVIGGGRIVEQGSHADLLARRGRYARLFELQAEGYR